MAVDLRIVRRPAGESLSGATLNFRQKIASNVQTLDAVSYTHLTLPTIYSV